MLFRLVAAGFIAVTFTASPASADAATLVEKLGGKYKRTVSFAGQLLLKCDASNVSLPLVAALKEDYGNAYCPLTTPCNLRVLPNRDDWRDISACALIGAVAAPLRLGYVWMTMGN